MAFLGHTFDANTVEPAKDFEPLPSGDYVAMIIDSDMKATKSGSGQYLELTYQILDGPFKGRNVWARLNLVNQNATAAQIAAQQLSAICHAVGRLQVQDSAALHNIPHMIRVEFVKANEKRDRDGNEVKGFKKIEGQAPAAAPFAQAATPAANQAAPAAAPAWAKPAA